MLSVCAAAAALLLLLFFPELCTAGAAQGLSLWYRQIVPTLLPAMILTGWITSRRQFQSFLSRLPSASAIPYITGLLCGSPMGAKVCRDLYRSGLMDKRKAAGLCILVQMPSPVFILGFTAGNCLHSKQPLLFAFSVYLPSVIAWLLFLYGELHDKTVRKESSGPLMSVFQADNASSFEEVYTDSLLVMIKIGILMMYFTMITSLILHLFPASPVLLFLTGLLEMTTGILQFSGLAVSTAAKTAICLFYLGFGGLCVHMQVRQTWGADFSYPKYIVCRLLYGLCSCTIYIFFSGI